MFVNMNDFLLPVMANSTAVLFFFFHFFFLSIFFFYSNTLQNIYDFPSLIFFHCLAHQFTVVCLFWMKSDNLCEDMHNRTKINRFYGTFKHCANEYTKYVQTKNNWTYAKDFLNHSVLCSMFCAIKLLLIFFFFQFQYQIHNNAPDLNIESIYFPNWIVIIIVGA